MSHEKLYAPLQPGHIRLLQLEVQEGETSDHIISCSLSCVALTDLPNATSSAEGCSDWYELSTASWDYRSLFYPISLKKSVRRYLARLPKSREVSTLRKAVYRNIAPQRGYAALSYVWGPSTQNKQIRLDGHMCAVTDNLYAALQQLKRCEAVKQGLSVWVDALCIDQADLEERAAQIQLMHQIYARAQHIMIWLGPEVPWTKPAFTAIHWIADQHYEEMEQVKARQSLLPLLYPSTFPNTLPFKAIVMLGLWHLFSLPYWRRVWIVQEAALTKSESPVVWGPFCISTRQLETAARYIDMNTGLSRAITYAAGNDVTKQTGGLSEVFTADCSLQNRETSPARLWRLTLQVLRSSSNEPQRTDDLASILDVLRLAQLAKCTDPRDKVFAILSVPALRPRVHMKSDYTCKLGDVFRLFSTHLFRDGDLNALRLVQAPVAPLHTTWQLQNKPFTISKRFRWVYYGPHLPKENFLENWDTIKESWKGRRPRKIAVPACTHELPSWTICLACATAPVLPLPDGFRAGASLFAGIQHSTSISNHILTTNGAFVDILTTLSAFNAREDSRNYPVNLPINSPGLGDPYTNLESVQEALCRTLLADTMPDGSPVPQQMSLRYTLLDRQLWIRSGPVSPHRSHSEGYELKDFFERNKELRIADSLLFKELLVPSAVKRAARHEAGRSDLITRATNMLAWRRLVCTSVGRLGLVPAHAQQNDRVVILQGCNVPLVLRKQEETWKLIGECYLHPIMRDKGLWWCPEQDEWSKNIESVRVS